MYVSPCEANVEKSRSKLQKLAILAILELLRESQLRLGFGWRLVGNVATRFQRQKTPDVALAEAPSKNPAPIYTLIP